MKRTTRKNAALLLTVLLVFSLMISVHAADSDGYLFDDLGKKAAQPLVTPGQYEVTVSVPGAVETEEYSEIIVMVDASDSQGPNLEKLKAMLVSLAEDVLHDDGSMRLTLMGYGMGPARVGSFYNAETLEEFLADVTQADLLQGVSATNCEAALDFVREYIEQSPKLHKTFVIFTSDGMTNMDQTTFDLSQWLEHPEWYMKGANPPMIGSYAAGGQADLLLTGGTILTPTARLYPEEAVTLALTQSTHGLASAEYMAAVDALYGKITATEESVIAYTNAIWEDVFAHSGLTFGKGTEYSTSVLEKAFIDYHGGIMTNSYLCTIHGMMEAGFYPDWHKLPTWGARAAAAADKLAANEKVLELYMMDFASKDTTWMNPDSTSANHCTSNKISYNTAKNFSAAVDKIETLGSEIFVTVYNNTTVIDPMSKWVILDPDSIRIYEDDLLIYRYGEGWLYEDKQPAAEPIILTKSEDGRYQITWRIKDGNLLYSDRYFLKYTVSVDETVEGFRYDTMYPANDPTFAQYNDVDGNPIKKTVQVPDVKEPKPGDEFSEGEKGFKIYKGSSIDNTPISGIQFDVYHVVPAEGEFLNPTPTEEEYSKYVSDETFVGSIVTDANGYGYLNLTKLGYGDGFYLIIEQPNEKIKEPVAPFYASIPMPDPGTHALMDIVVMYPKNEPVTSKPPIPPDIPEDPENPETGRITVLKHSAKSQDIVLGGAQFQIYRLAGEGETPTASIRYNEQDIGIVPATVEGQAAIITTGADGIGTSDELPIGLYFLIETQAPDGYYLTEQPVAVFVTTTSHEVTNAEKISNPPGVKLPETGGPGTWMFTFSGTLLCVGAVILLLQKKRRFTE